MLDEVIRLFLVTGAGLAFAAAMKFLILLAGGILFPEDDQAVGRVLQGRQ